jgi:HSP20 family protein
MLRFDPFRDLDRLSEQMSRSTRSMLAFDAVRDDDEVIVYFDVPGVESDDIEVNVEKNELTVKVERRWSDDNKRVIASERGQGSFTRQLMLNDALDTEKLEAKLENGVLIIAIPVDESSKQRRIEVQSGGSAKAIDAKSSESDTKSGKKSAKESAE